MRLNKYAVVTALFFGALGSFATIAANKGFADESSAANNPADAAAVAGGDSDFNRHFHWPHFHWPHWPHPGQQTPAPQAPHLPMAEKEWTFLIYLNGNNSLDSFGPVNIEQMEKVGSTDKVNVVVQWASAADSAHTKRLYIEKSSDSTKVTSPVVQDAGDVDMGDYKSFGEFVKWGVANFPAQHYFLDIWNHGNGWESTGPGERGVSANSMLGTNLMNPMDLSWDDHTGHHITNTQMGLALADAAAAIGHKIDVYGSDACLMAMAEIATEVQDSVNVYVGSEETEPGAGWPYDAILNSWNALSDASPAAVGKVVTDEYTKSYNPGGENTAADVTFSAFDMSKLAAFNTTLTLFSDNLAKLDAQAKAKVVTTAGTTMGFEIPEYHDVATFLANLESAKIDSVDASAMAAVHAAIQDLVIEVASTDKYKGAGGISLWIPTDYTEYQRWSGDYALTKFEKTTHWSETLNSLLKQ